MPEYNSSNSNFNSCTVCGWEFPADFLQKVAENNGTAVCEGCGTKIIKDIEKRYNSESEQEIEKNKTSWIRQIFENLRNKKSPIDRILFDSDFPLIFIENYIIVTSRIIYFQFLEMEKSLEFDFQNGELTEEIVEILFKKIEPITEQGIMPEFLKNLKELNVKRFERWLRFQQSKLEVSEKYSRNFTFFLKWLIEKVFIIISELWNERELPKFNRIIRDDLKHYTFSKENSSLSLTEGVLKEVAKLCSSFEDPEILGEKTTEIYIDLISGPNILTREHLPLGYKTNPKYLASMLIFYGLKHEDYNDQYSKYRSYNIAKYLNEFYPNSSTMKTAMTTLPSKAYKFLSQQMRNKILYFPRGSKDVSDELREKVKMAKKTIKNEDFLTALKKSIKIYSEEFNDSEDLYSLALKIADDAFRLQSGLNFSELQNKIRYNSPKYFAIAFIFFAFNHKSYKNLNMRISAFSEKFFKDFKQSNNSVISFLYKYLSISLRNKINYLPKKRFNSDIIYDESLVWDYLSEYLRIFDKNLHESLLKNAKKLYDIAIQKGFNPNLLNSKNPKFLAVALVYFSLLNSDYKEKSKEQLFKKFRESGIEISHDMTNEVINQFYKLVKDHLSKIPRRITDRKLFRNSLEGLRSKAQKENRLGNVILYELILNIMELYGENFEKFTDDLNFISSQGTKRILERLSNPNVFDKESYLNHFSNNFKKLIKNLNASIKQKEKLFEQLSNFEETRKEYFNHNESKSKKRKREKERYNKYGENFYSFKARVARFLLMLGFSPFDGFDIWSNKIYVKGKYRIFANFHHYKYNPEENSKDDLVFIPIKPPINIRRGEYLTREYLTHNSISGLEGNLKRKDISRETRTKILKKLKKIERIIEYNSSLLEKAVFTQNYEYLKTLKNWKEVDISRAIERLKDNKFKWANKIEEYLPTAEGYEYERISAKETDLIIKKLRK